MSAESPNFTEVEYDVPHPIWTTDEVREAINKSKGLIVDDYAHLVDKLFIIDGQKVICTLRYSNPTNSAGWLAYVPFPDKTALHYSVRSFEELHVVRAPLDFSVGTPEGDDSEIDVSYKLQIPGMNALIARFNSVGGNYDNDFFKDGKKLAFLYLPDDPELVSTARITFIKNNLDANKT